MNGRLFAACCGAVLSSAATVGTAAAQGNAVATLSGHTAPVAVAVFSPDGAQLASGGHDGMARLWDLRSGKALWSYDFRSPVRGLAFSADGKLVALGGGGFIRREDGFTKHEPAGEIVLLDAASGKQSGSLRGHLGMVTTIIAHPDGKHLVSAGHDGLVIFWDLAAGREVRKLPRATAPIDDVAVSPDGALVAMPDGGGVKLFDFKSGELLREFQVDDRIVTTLAFSPDGKTLVTGSRSEQDAGKLAVWDPATGKALAMGDPMPRVSYTDIAFSPDGKTLVTASATSAGVQLRDPRTTQRRAVLSGHEGTISSVEFSPDGRMLVSASRDKTIRLWRSRSRRR